MADKERKIPTTDEIKEILKDLTLQQVETDKKIKEAAEARQDLAHRQVETDEQLKKTDKQIKELGKQVGGMHNRWGKIIESLLTGDLIAIVNKYMRVKVHHVSGSVKGEHQGKYWEIDLLAVNEGVVTPTEVKTTLSKKDIDHFLSHILCRFTELMPEHKDKKVHGIVAFVKVEGREKEVVDYAQSKGLMLIKAMSGTNKVINPEGFEFRDYHP